MGTSGRVGDVNRVHCRARPPYQTNIGENFASFVEARRSPIQGGNDKLILRLLLHAWGWGGALPVAASVAVDLHLRSNGNQPLASHTTRLCPRARTLRFRGLISASTESNASQAIEQMEIFRQVKRRAH